MLHLHCSNRLEVLADGLADLMQAAPLAPLEDECIVVPSSPLGRWLGFTVARRLGVAASLRVEFAAAFVWRLIRAVVPGVPEASPLEPETLQWRIASLLDAMRGTPAFAPVASYLDAGGDVQRHELAAATAAAFDRYLVYRPDWIEAWSAGRTVGLGADEAWQAALWRGIAAALPAAMQAHPRTRFFEALRAGAPGVERLPARVHLFAVAALPPLYLDTFARLAEGPGFDVHFHMLNPCREYWGAISKRRAAAEAIATGAPGAEHMEVGNELLAALGWHARATLDALYGLDPGDPAAFADPGRGTVLARLQSDILDLEERPAGAAPGDDSLAVHVCHGPTREVEVLHDRLLDAFERDPTLRPEDVLVLVPQIDAYAPAIEAVFATAPAARRLAFSIADRGLAASVVARAFRQLLALPGSRFEAETLVALLETAAVGRRFGIVLDELPLVRQWLRDAGVRWGRDERHRAALGLPATRANTWRAGLDRLLLGYALPGDDTHLFAGVLPYDAVEGGAAALAGCLATFAEAVFELADDLARPRPMAAWQTRLERLLRDFFEPDADEADDVALLRAAIAGVARSAERAGAREPVPLAIVVRELVAAAEAGVRSHAFLGGGITFAALLPGRAVPARIVALLGLNDGEYPRQHRPPGFDLVARHPRAGDRIRRDEDRHAFLEALLAARERLWLAYTGRSVRDNDPRPPSPLVAEVLEAVGRASGEAAARACVVEHPLQPFSRRYFDGSEARLFSYAEAYATPSRRDAVPAPFLSGPLPAAGQPAKLTAETLCDALRNPARRLLRDRLGIRLEAGEGALEDTEPFELDGLAEAAVRRRTFAWLREGRDPEAARALARASGELPHGAAGDARFARVVAEIAPLAARAAEAGDVARTVIEADCGARRLVASVGAAETFVPGRVRARHRIDAWVRHLALQCVRRQASALHGIDVSVRFVPVEGADALLAALVALEARMADELVPFFPEAALAYAVARASGGDADARAARAWFPDPSGEHPGERDRDPYFALAFGNVADPLDDAFRAVAAAVCGPLVAAAVETRA
jgi:exodeoxyribonuclease V gamma subunit